MMVDLYWGDCPLTWDGVPLQVDEEEWDAMLVRLRQILDRIRSRA